MFRIIENEKSKTRYQVNFDDRGVVDTIKNCKTGKMLKATSSVAKKVTDNQEDIRRKIAPKGFKVF